MRAKPSIVMSVLIAALLSAVAADTANTKPGKHGKHWHHFRGKAVIRSLPRPSYPDIGSASSAVPAGPPAALVPHAEWCGRAYQTYDYASDTYLRFDGVRVPCIGP